MVVVNVETNILVWEMWWQQHGQQNQRKQRNKQTNRREPILTGTHSFIIHNLWVLHLCFNDNNGDDDNVDSGFNDNDDDHVNVMQFRSAWLRIKYALSNIQFDSFNFTIWSLYRLDLFTVVRLFSYVRRTLCWVSCAVVDTFSLSFFLSFAPNGAGCHCHNYNDLCTFKWNMCVVYSNAFLSHWNRLILLFQQELSRWEEYDHRLEKTNLDIK